MTIAEAQPLSEAGAETCPQCGVELVASAAFCHRCGTVAGSAPPAIGYEQAKPAGGYEYMSPRTIFGLPLVHVCNGVRDPQTGRLKPAKGLIAVGDVAMGLIFAQGRVAVGGIAFGGMAVGIFAFGGLALGAVAAGGGIAVVGALACGGVAVSLGTSMGGVAVGGWVRGGVTYDLTRWTGI